MGIIGKLNDCMLSCTYDVGYPTQVSINYLQENGTIKKQSGAFGKSEVLELIAELHHDPLQTYFQ